MDPLALTGENGHPVEQQYFSDPTADLTGTLTLGQHSSGGCTFILTVRAGDAASPAPLLVRAETHGTQAAAEQAGYTTWRTYCRARIARGFGAGPAPGGTFPRSGKGP